MENLALRLMIELYYQNEGPLPADPNEVARLIDMKEHVTEVSTVLYEFFEFSEATLEDAECYMNADCEAVISAYRAKAEIARENGKRGGRPSKTKTQSVSDKTQSVLDKNPVGTQAKPDRKLTVNRKPIKKKKQKSKLSAPGRGWTCATRTYIPPTNNSSTGKELNGSWRHPLSI
jgi:uncharacterized protein YdaU (DUF1376 family)